MTSDLQRQTAAENGKRSRGPRTLAGKLVSRRNAFKYCLTARLLTHDTKSPESYIRVLAALFDEIQPETELETQLVESIAHARWRTMRTWTGLQ